MIILLLFFYIFLQITWVIPLFLLKKCFAHTYIRLFRHLKNSLFIKRTNKKAVRKVYNLYHSVIQSLHHFKKVNQFDNDEQQD